MKRVLSLQFGNPYARRHPGYVLVGPCYSSPYHLWMSPVVDCANMNAEDARLETYVSMDRPAEFRIGMANATYEITLTSFEKEKEHGPFTVRANDEFVAADIEIPAGETVRRTFRCRAVNNMIRLEFVPQPGRDFLINTLEVKGRTPVKLVPLFKTAPSPVLPSRGQLVRRSENDPAGTLGTICDWLVARCRSDGFFGDSWGGPEYWYTSSMPIRALLAGYEILGRKEYLESSLTALDVFVGEQMPNGAWGCEFRGKPTAAMSNAEQEQFMATQRQPMSDIGSVVGALAVACQYTDAARKTRYVKALRDFCENWAPRYQDQSGAFTDGFWPGVAGIYSCATAIQAGAFALTYRITGDPAFMRVATKAIGFLLKDWREDGRMLGRAPCWSVRNRDPFVMETLYFGDQWYYDDGFVTTWHHCPDEEFRGRINDALSRRALGTHGLVTALKGNVWWPVQDIWNNAKSIGMVQTLMHVQRHGKPNASLAGTLDNMRRFLCAPEHAASLGVMPNDDERPASVYGIQTWSGMRMESTGFAGMTLAEMIKPGVLYLAPGPAPVMKGEML